MEEISSLKRVQVAPDSAAVREQPIQEMSREQATALSHLKIVYPEYQDPSGLFGRIIKVMAYVQEQPESAFHMPVSATREHAIFVTSRDFHIVQKTAGKGTQSTAYFTVSIPMDGGDPKNQLIKTARSPFDPEVERLNLLSPASKLSSKIDHFMGAYGLLQSAPTGIGSAGYIAIFNASSCDLCHIDYRTPRVGVHFVLRQLVDIAEGVGSFHRANMVLRDIKGANLLCNPWEGPGKVTDFGLISALAPEGVKHSTALTPKYAAPFIWDSILGQKYRSIKGKRSCEGGYQGKAADIFALGRTIQLDVINLILRQYGKKYDVVLAPFVDHLLIPETLTGHFSDRELEAFEAVHPGKVFHVGIDPRRGDVLHIFKDAETILNHTLQALGRLKKAVSEKEYLALQNLAQLAMELQNLSKRGLLAFLGADAENEGDVLISAVRERLKVIRDASAPSIPFHLPSLPNEQEAKTGHFAGEATLNIDKTIELSLSESKVSSSKERRHSPSQSEQREAKRAKKNENDTQYLII
ncbi:MAG: hypothetical protein KFB93_08865 [Simkaniaceae bacterium]|nr:MAG: hypothetical protein KFB93_08865 [Simkaniaceae bacterium]